MWRKALEIKDLSAPQSNKTFAVKLPTGNFSEITLPLTSNSWCKPS